MRLSRIVFAALALGLQTNAALAFQLGRRMRTPDWMDPYFIMLLIMMVVFYLMAQLTKPKGVRLQGLDHARLPFLPRFYYSIAMLSGVLLIVGVFFGNYLDRRDDYIAEKDAEVQELQGEVARILAESNVSKHPVLRFRGVQDMDILPEQLTGMGHVKYLSLHGTEVRDLSLLTEMPQLEGLKISKTRVTDLSPLAGLIGLEKLELNSTQVKDLTALAGLTSLKELELAGTRVADLTPLSELPALETLQIGNTNVTDISPLADVKTLKSLSMNRTSVADIAPLTGHPSLQLVKLERSKVADLRPALTWPAMQPFIMQSDPTSSGLHYANTPATDADPELDKLWKTYHKQLLERIAAHYGVEWVGRPKPVEEEPPVEDGETAQADTDAGN